MNKTKWRRSGPFADIYGKNLNNIYRPHKTKTTTKVPDTFSEVYPNEKEYNDFFRITELINYFEEFDPQVRAGDFDVFSEIIQK